MFFVFALLLLISTPIVLYLYLQLSKGITRSAKCLIGKTAIITGGNSGIGYQVALNFASRGCRVILADIADMEESKQNIIKFTSNPNIIIKKLNLASLKSIREFADDIVKTEKRLDILINNAGVCASTVDKTEDGLDNLTQINYLGHFLLTHLLIDLLKKSAPSRIVFTSTFMVFENQLTAETLNDGFKKFSDNVNYANSKLALLIASDIFAEKLKNSGVTANAVHPGVVKTSLINILYNTPGKMNPFVKFLVKLLLKLYAKDAWEGAQTLVHVALSNKLENVSGRFFWDCKELRKPAKAKDTQFCQEIWNASEILVGLREDEKI